MPGNQAVFDEALAKSRDALERQAWLEALTEAVRAVQEFPSDLEARHTVAVALYHNKKYDQAIQIFEELRTHRGDDVLTLAYLARSYEAARQPKEAVAVLLALATLAQQQGQMDDAEEALSEAVRLAPSDEAPRLAMAQFFLDIGEPRRAAEQCVEVARARFTAGDRAGAEEALQEALDLDPENGNAHTLHATIAAPNSDPRVQTGALPRREATGELQGQQAQIDNLIARAMQAQAVGNHTEALSSYLKVIELGVERADVRYNLAILLQERGDHEQAVRLLRDAARNDDYALSAYFALGESLRALGRLQEAADAFDKSLAHADLENIGRGEADDLIAMFQATAGTYEELGDLSRAASLYMTLARVFQNKRWGRELSDQFKARARALNERSMVVKLERIGTGRLSPDTAHPAAAAAKNDAGSWGVVTRMDGTARSEGDVFAPSLADADPFMSLNLPEVGEPTYAPLTPLPTEGCSDEVVRSVTASTKMMEQGLVRAALDACYEVIRLDPSYVPIHVRIGEILERDGQPEQALMKYRTVIDTYTAREQPAAAIDAYYRFLELSPDAVQQRSQLAQLLRAQGKIDEAVEQVLQVTHALTRAGNHDRALQEFRQMAEWAPPSCAVHKAHGQTLLRMGRWQEALQEFRRAVRCTPGDPVAFALVNIAMALIGKNEEAVVESLQGVIDRLASQPGLADAVIAEYRSALAVEDGSLLHYLLGRVQQATGQHASAMLSFQHALSLLALEESPLLAPLVVQYALATTYIAQEQPAEALEALTTVQQLMAEQPPEAALHPLQRPPDEGVLCQQLANIHMARGDQSAALHAWKQCMQADPNHVESYTQLADLYFRQGKLQAALDQYDWLATLYEDRQQLEQAIATLRHAVTLAPSSITMRERLARLLLRRGYSDAGLQEIEEVIRLQTAAGLTNEAIASMRQAADAFMLLSRFDAAAATYRDIIRLAPDDLDTRHQLVNALLLQGSLEDAIAEQHLIAQQASALDDRNAFIEALSQLVALEPENVGAAEQLAAATAE